MSAVRNLTVGEQDAGLRLDRWFKQRFPELGHGRLEKLLRTGQVRVDGGRAKSGTRLEAGQTVRVPPLPEPAAAPRARTRHATVLAERDLEALHQAVLYRDDWVIAIDKPAGLAVQGGTGQHRHLDAMLEALSFGADEPPRLVHRLDKDTSGVLLLARTAQAARALTEAFRGKEVRKLYWAAVAGVPKKPFGRIAVPLDKRAGRGGEKVGATQRGKEAVTLYQVAARRGKKAAWLVLSPLTGRTHQLRVHCAALGHPILGDGKYGGRDAFPKGAAGAPLAKRLQLHAREVACPHPADGTTLRITAPLPPHMAETWAALGFDPAVGEAAAAALENRERSAAPAEARSRKP
ncbi:MAG: RluA family pseudouridine synthase [Rhodospirillales bacterium]|nr:RluA family pseudouridine synthase [Rhodospirillales bacterium]MDH3791482.1 RluA family pseudouridine synthase [Rhodospirillales bacterium]MDH3918902.1 RluA family pseudouridine synthase [Rhodospirillales bacterium]MDH3968600.1 RluA family pseudouridine synthase [Rhodospirillales bacterium]